MANITYKSFDLFPAAMQLTDTGRWTLEIVIRKHHDTGFAERRFSALTTFVTQSEAEAEAIAFGRGIIDGAFPDLSVESLA